MQNSKNVVYVLPYDRIEEVSADNINVHVGNYIKYCRRSRNLTQRNLADILGVAYQQVQKYEKGTCNISMKRFCQIFEGLNISIPTALLVFQGKKLEYYLMQKGKSDASHYLDSISNPDIKKAIIDLCKEIAAK